MSNEAITWAYKTQVGSSAQKAVLLVLANYADENDSAYPGIVRISTMTQLSERTVQRAIAEMEELGVIRVERRTNTTSRYFINMGWTGEGGDTVTPGVVTPRHQGGDTVTSNTKKTPERDTKPKSAARRAAVGGSRSRPTRQRPVEDTGEGLEVTGGGVKAPKVAEPTDIRKGKRRARKPTPTSLAHVFAKQASEADDIPVEARDTIINAAQHKIAKWQDAGISLDDVRAAMELFFVSPATYLKPGKTLWFCFHDVFPALVTRATAPDITNPDYYSDQQQEDTLYDSEQYLEEMRKQLGIAG